MKMEIRISPTSITTNEDGSMTVEGYVNKTNQWSELLGRGERFKEKIAPGAFQSAIDNADEIHFLAEHDGQKILSSTRNGSLSLSEDNQGLLMRATISPTTWGKDYYQLIKDGILQNMSFGFRAIKDAWKKVDGYFERTVNELELFEVSVVRDPAYSQSTISARGIDLIEDAVPAEEPIVQTEIKIDIRSEADIQSLADQIFSKMKEMFQPVESQEDSVEEQDEVVVEDAQEESQEQDDSIIDVGSEVESVDETSVDDEETESAGEETVEEQYSATAQKIRDFINQYKV